MDALDNSAMFAPRARAPAGKSLMRTNLVEKTSVFLFPKDLSPEEKMQVGLLLCLTATSVNATLEEWKSYVSTYTCFLIPELVGKLRKESFSTVNVSKASLGPLFASVSRYIAMAQAEEDQNTLPDDGLVGLRLHNGLPAIEGQEGHKWVGAEATAKHIYAHYSLVVFLAGKQISDLNRAAITENRPAAIIGKCRLDEITLILNGSLRISNVGHSYIFAAWSEMTSFRAECFFEFINYASIEVDLGQDIIYTSVHLLRHANMSHARLSYKLLRSNPWVVTFAPLASSVSVFLDSIRSAAKLDENLQPYVKLIYGDKSGVFPRKEMEPLVACAAALEEEMSDTVTNFVRSDRYAAVVDLFLEERRARMSTSRTARVGTLAEIEDEAGRTHVDTTTVDNYVQAEPSLRERAKKEAAAAPLSLGRVQETTSVDEHEDIDTSNSVNTSPQGKRSDHTPATAPTVGTT